MRLVHTLDLRCSSFFCLTTVEYTDGGLGARFWNHDRLSRPCCEFAVAYFAQHTTNKKRLIVDFGHRFRWQYRIKRISLFVANDSWLIHVQIYSIRYMFQFAVYFRFFEREIEVSAPWVLCDFSFPVLYFPALSTSVLWAWTVDVGQASPLLHLVFALGALECSPGSTVQVERFSALLISIPASNRRCKGSVTHGYW